MLNTSEISLPSQIGGRLVLPPLNTLARGHHKPRHCKVEVGENEIKRRENRNDVWTKLRAQAAKPA